MYVSCIYLFFSTSYIIFTCISVTKESKNMVDNGLWWLQIFFYLLPLIFISCYFFYTYIGNTLVTGIFVSKWRLFIQELTNHYAAFLLDRIQSRHLAIYFLNGLLESESLQVHA